MLAQQLIKPRQPSLRTLGIAVEHFPHYVNRTINLHSLDVVLLSFILRGRGRHMVDEETFTENGASLTVTHYGQRHEIVTGPRGMEVINVYLDLQHHPLPSLPRGLQQVLPLFLPLHPKFQHRLNRIVRLRFGDPQPFADLLFAIQRELQSRPAGYEEAVAIRFKLFLMLCCRHAIAHGIVPSSRADAPPPHGIEDVRMHLDQHYAATHTLSALAKRARLSRTSLCRVFKAYTGKRVFDYLIERRIQAAMVHLHARDDKVLSIALECGFHDLAHFNRKFKQLVGTTPSSYRGRGKTDALKNKRCA